MRKFTGVLFVIAALTVQIMAGEAQAALKAFSPNPYMFNNPPPSVTFPNHVAGPVPLGGIPSWFQDQNGVSVQPCVDVVKCGLIGLGDPMFNEAFPMSYPDNFPTEAFYTDNVAIFSLAPSPVEALVVLAMEYTFVDPVTGTIISANPRPANALGFTFQRQRLVLSYPPGVPVPTAGVFTLANPWGVTTYPFGAAKCVNNAGGQKCTMTQDLPLGGPPNPTAALGIGVPGTISTFLKDPAAPAGFLGIGAAAASYTGFFAPGTANAITVTDPLGNTGTSTTLTLLVGQTIGLEVQPGAHFNLGPATIGGAPSLAKTVTITNASGNPITFPDLTLPAAKAGANAGDFTIVTPAAVGAVFCSGATIGATAPNNACSFDITFSPLVGTTAARSATIAVNPLTVQPAPPPAAQLTDPPPVTINLSGTAQYPLTVAVATTDTSTGLALANDGSGTLTVSSPGQPSLVCSNVGNSIPIANVTAAPVPCTASFDVGSVVTLTPAANPSPLSLFDGWAGSCSGTGACTVTMDGPKGVPAVPGPATAAVTASFIDSHLIATSATPAAGGTITSTLTVRHASTPTLIITPTSTASPRVSYRIGSVTDSAGTVTLTPVGTNSFSYQLPPVDQDHTVTANFIQQFILTTTAGIGGAVTPATAQTLDSGTSQSFTITPDAGYRIGSVQVDNAAQVVSATPFTLPITSVTGDHSVSATFIKIWNVTSSVDGSGNVDNLGTKVFDDGKPASYTFTPTSNKFKVGKILVNDAPQLFTKPATIAGPVTFTLPSVTANSTVSAVFVPSGDLDANGTVDIADALKALKILVNLQTADSTPGSNDLLAMKIGGLETVTIGTQTSLVPRGGNGVPDLNDIILILKKAIKAVNW